MFLCNLIGEGKLLLPNDIPHTPCPYHHHAQHPTKHHQGLKTCCIVFYYAAQTEHPLRAEISSFGTPALLPPVQPIQSHP